ncbi:T9SS C-terminal target domain-containing protein [Paraflavitalea soli]|uniref:T9SS C-terminal target domain-containing protein n=1 Tax=Paraflavitalea soli TaxID=2315862 RepID=A0A3B7MM71_9BACT|nr:LamG-like jellyroll fold domain-containing protein [Paraflavitalea soli]AXY74140.1 T9SS C-terminal target domain-containing protein [Paraflavitalea soli]
MKKILTNAAAYKAGKLNCFLAVLFILLLSSKAGGQTFTHPGIPLSGSDLSILKAHVQAGDYPWKQAYDILAADGKSQLSYTMQGPFDSVARNINYNLNQWRSDMSASFNLSLMWYFTGNEAYAVKARDILVAWANKQTGFGGQEANLDLGDYAYAFGGAASILRGTWSGWTPANTTAVKNLFNNVYWKASGCAGYALGPANKGTLSIAAGAAIAAFSDEPAKVAHVIHLMRYIGSTGFKNTLPSGEHGESGRDQGHSHGMWGSIAFAAEVFWKQGLDLYSELDNRLLALGEYFSRRNTEGSIGFIPFGTTDWYYLTDPPGVWDGGRWGLTLLHGAYVVRNKLNPAYITKRLTDIPRRFDPVYTWFYKSEDNSTAVVPPQTQFVPDPGKVGTGGLTSLDIGTAAPAGSSSYNNNTWTVTGGGAEILTHSADGLHFVYKEVTGNCSIIAKVESVGGTALNARAGLMIRSDLTATAAQRAWIAIKSGKRAESYMHGWTEMRGGSNWEKPERTIPQDAYWVKIDRVGDVIATYYSPDGVSWATEVQGRYAGFTGTAYIGLAVCSNANGVPMTATFSNVSVTGGQGGMVILPEAPHSVYAYAGNNQVQLRWLSSFGADTYTLKRANSEAGPYSTIAAILSGNSFMDNNVMNGQAYYYKVCAVNTAGTSADAPADSATPYAPYVLQTLDGLYRIIVTHSGKAIEVKNGSTADSALVTQNTYSFKSNQHWIISPLSGTDYKITNLLSGKVMDIVGNAITDGARIEQRTWSATDSGQIWFIKDRGNGTFSIVAKQSQKALEVPGSNTADGVTMDIYRWTDGPNQIFQIEPVTASAIDSAYQRKLAEAIQLRDTTVVSTTNELGKFPVAARAQLNDSISHVQSLYNPQSTVIEISGYVTILENAIKRYKASMYYGMNTLPNGNYYLKTLTGDSLWTKNNTNTPLFDTVNSDPLLQVWNVTKQGNGRYKIICLSAPSSFSNYINENAQFGRSVSPYLDAWNSMNIYFDGTSYAIQRAQTAGNGYWYQSDDKILTEGGNENDPVPYTFPFRFVPVDDLPVNLMVAAGDAKNILEWNPAHNLSYRVKRSTTAGGPYTTMATVSTIRYTDTVVSNGTTYYYVIASIDSTGEGPSSTEVTALPNIGQLAYLKFNEPGGTRAFDSWGAMHGTLAAAATRTAGKDGNALKLDGTANAYATLPAGIVSTLNDFTVSAWVKMDALANWMRVFDFGNSTTQYMFLSVQIGTPTVNGVKLSTVRYAIKNGGTELNVSSNYTFPLNTWVHLAVTQSGNTARLYINGSLVSTNTAINIKPAQLTPAGATTGTSLNYLGKSQFNDPIFNGAIDEFKIYKRALSDAEIAENAKEQQTITFNTLTQKEVSDSDFNAGATASSGLPVTYVSSDTTVATILNGMVHITGKGMTTITASQNGDNTYKAATPVAQQLIVYRSPVLTAPLDQFFCYAQSGVYSIPSLTATDSGDIASISYSVSGATARNGNGSDASGAFNAGQSTITWTVTDVHGNSKSASTSVTVNTAVITSIPDVYAMNPAVDARNTIYIGYGPTSLNVTANTTGGAAPYSYQWSSGQTTPVISVDTTETYTVIVTDSNGCSSTASIVIKTMDVRCGNNNNKVMICHNNKTICISAASVQDHLNHGDHLGDCQAQASVARMSQENGSAEANSGNMSVYPNPVTEILHVQVTGVQPGAVIRMYNQNGMLVKTILVARTSEAVSVRGLAAGVYYLQIKSSGALITKKIIKL